MTQTTEPTSSYIRYVRDWWRRQASYYGQCAQLELASDPCYPTVAYTMARIAASYGLDALRWREQ